MPEKILPGIHRIDIPLPNLELDHLNSYLIKNEQESVLIDIGPNSDEAFQILKNDLNQINNSFNLREILFTHFHIDHIGLFRKIKDYQESSIRSRFSVEESEYLEKYLKDFETFWNNQLEFGSLNGVPKKITDLLKNFHPGLKEMKVYEDLMNSNVPIKSEEKIKIGEHQIVAIGTPGHSPGHTCFYDSSKRLLFAGDHILKTTTPSIVQLKESGSELANYFKSLEKIDELEIDLVLPGHGEPYKNHHERVKQLFEHHEERLEEIMEILEEGKASAYQTASKISWDVNYSSWSDFPIFQKWLATGETIAHLHFLEKEGRVEKVTRNNSIFYEV